MLRALLIGLCFQGAAHAQFLPKDAPEDMDAEIGVFVEICAAMPDVSQWTEMEAVLTSRGYGALETSSQSLAANHEDATSILGNKIEDDIFYVIQVTDRYAPNQSFRCLLQAFSPEQREGVDPNSLLELPGFEPAPVRAMEYYRANRGALNYMADGRMAELFIDIGSLRPDELFNVFITMEK